MSDTPVMPPGAIPVDQFQAADMNANAPTQEAQNIPKDAIPIDQFESHEDKYGSGTQQAVAGVEGLARGVAGPVATLVEKHLLGVPEEDIKGREDENPITAGIGEGVGLIGSTLTGVGEGALLAKAGEAASGLTKAGTAVNAAREAALAAGQGAKAAELAAEAAMKAQPLVAKVGSAAVQQAAEMAVLQSGNEIHKMILNDPDSSAESAIANIGLASALGAGTGAFITGAVSPLWKATAAEPLEKGLAGIRNHLNGGTKALPEELQSAADTLGIQVPELIKGGNRSDKMGSFYNDLKRMEKPDIAAAEEAFHRDISESVSNSLNIRPDDVAIYSENEAGHDLFNAFQKEYKQKYEPFQAAYDAKRTEANKIFIPDEVRLTKYDTIITKGMETVGTDSPYYKIYDEYAERLLAKDTVGGIDNLVTEINNRVKGLKVGGDHNIINALNDIKSGLKDFQEMQIARQANELEASGMAGAKKMSADLLNERADLNRQYAEFAKMSDELTSNLGVGGFRGAKSLEGKLADDITPESLLKKFSIKNNSDFIPFLEKYFPETLSQVKQNELKTLIKPAVLSAKGENAINVKKLGDIIDKNMAGKKEYVEALLGSEALEKIAAAQKLQSAIPNIKDSGTPAGLLRNLAAFPASAMAMVAAYAGHNPIVGGIAGHLTQYMGRDMPDAIKLAMLKFSASEQPVKAEGFKAMVEYMHNTMKGETALIKGTKAIFKGSAQVLTEHAMPAKADNEKLDKMVTQYRERPESLMEKAKGDTGHYMPDHQVSLTRSTTQAMQYLETIKPKSFQAGPLDKPIEPTPAEEARYQRALTIANTPMSLLNHIKQGTIQPSDIQDLKGMYPALYDNMAQKLSNELIHAHESEEAIPYKTRMGISIFLGQAIDSSMTPSSIMAAQPKPKAPPPGQGQAKGSSLKNLGKSNSSYLTPGQSAEAHKAQKH